MTVNFQKIIIKNFFSVGNNPLTILYNKSPTTAVVGQSGVGKSSIILDSLHFACYGKPYRSVNIPNVVNSINDSDCVVELFVQNGSKEYRIVRGLKPKIFEIYENGNLIDQDAATKDYQEWLETYVLSGMNETIFKQIVIIGSSNYTPFMELPAASRREVIEELLDIKIFSSMLNIVKERISGIKESLTTVDQAIILDEEKIKLHKDSKKKSEEDVSKKIVDLENRIKIENKAIDAILEDVTKINAKRVELVQKYDKFPIVNQKRKDLETSIITLENERNNSTKMLKFFGNTEVCPSCAQNIDHDHKRTLMDEQGNRTLGLSVEISKLKVDMDSADVILDALSKIKSNIDLIDRDVYSKHSDINTRKKYIQTLEKDITILQKPNKKVDNNISHLEDDLAKNKKKQIEILEEKQYYDIISGLLKDGGIKTKIIRQYIPVMNKIINEYLTRFSLPVEFSLDENFNEVIKSRYRDKFQYMSFSEGEKSRINSSILLAWRQLSKSKNTLNTNLMVFDETMDTHLDNNGVDDFVSILLELDKNLNIFVISHKPELENKFHSVLRLEKINNFTQVA